MRGALGALAGLVLAALLAWIGYETVQAGSDVPTRPPQVVTKLVGGRADEKRLNGDAWSLDYRSATLSGDSQIAQIDDVRDGLILRKGKPAARMQAKHVTANVAGNEFTAQGNVVVTEVRKPFRRLTTDQAHFVGASDTLVLDHRTTIVQGSITLVVDHATVNFTTGDTQLGRIVGTM